VKNRYAPTVTAASNMGCALKNDLSTTSFALDRGWSKVANIDPAIAEQYAKGMHQNQIWHRLSRQTWSTIYAPKTAARKWIRNATGIASAKPALGCWWSVVLLGQSLWQDAGPPPPKRSHPALQRQAPQPADAGQPRAAPSTAMAQHQVQSPQELLPEPPTDLPEP